MSAEFLYIASGVSAFLASVCVVSFQLMKGSSVQNKQSGNEKCNRTLSPWYLASLKSAAVFGATIPIGYALLGMSLTGGRLEIFTLALGFMVAIPIGITYGFINSFIVHRVTLGIIGRFALGFVSGQLIFFLFSLKTIIGLALAIPVFGLIALVIGGVPSALCAVLVTHKLQQWVFFAPTTKNSNRS